MAQTILPPYYEITKRGVAKPERTDEVVTTTKVPTWRPHQDGNVVIAEPKLVSIERAQRGNEAVERDLQEM